MSSNPLHRMSWTSDESIYSFKLRSNAGCCAAGGVWLNLCARLSIRVKDLHEAFEDRGDPVYAGWAGFRRVCWIVSFIFDLCERDLRLFWSSRYRPDEVSEAAVVSGERRVRTRSGSVRTCVTTTGSHQLNPCGAAASGRTWTYQRHRLDLRITSWFRVGFSTGLIMSVSLSAVSRMCWVKGVPQGCVTGVPQGSVS